MRSTRIYPLVLEYGLGSPEFQAKSSGADSPGPEPLKPTGESAGYICIFTYNIRNNINDTDSNHKSDRYMNTCIRTILTLIIIAKIVILMLAVMKAILVV